MTQKTGDFGFIYEQFKGKPKEAIKHLLRVKHGECTNALYRKEIGYIDIVWGENDENNKGYGLKHIAEKHGHEIKQMGFNIEDFIPIVVQYGTFSTAQKYGRYIFESEMFRFVVAPNFHGRKKNWLLTAFDLRKRPK